MVVTSKPHAALLASPGMGHLIPIVELGKRLLTHHGFDVTIFVVTTDSSTTASQILQQTSNLTALNVVVLPPVDISTKLEPDNRNVVAKIVVTMVESLPSLRSSFQSMKPRPSVLIVDLFGTSAFPLAREFGISTYVFLTTNAWFSAVTIYFPFIDTQSAERHAHNHEPLSIPGCEPVRFEDTLESLLLPGGPAYTRFEEVAREIVSADGILINTWQDLEPKALKALMKHEILGRFSKGSVYTVGPLARSIEPKSRREDHEVLRWLDRQPAKSVIYVSFGSGGTMSKRQMKELALGLELSQQRFVWVVRPPNEGDASAAFFRVASEGDETTPGYLPEGFVTRTRGVGSVVPMWAPQAEILAHPATGGFVTHCGWNSVLESILNGIPMVAWPLYAEQKMNAAMLSEEIGVAVRVRAEEANGGVVSREQIAKVIRRVMVGEESTTMRAKVKELKLSAEKALSKSGSSYESLSQMNKV